MLALKIIGLIVYTGIIIFSTVLTVKNKWSVIVDWFKKVIEWVKSFKK